MSRMLILGAAVVALILAIVLGSTLLYGIAALFLVGFLVVQFGPRALSAVSVSSRQPIPEPSEQKLSDFGILEIRPKESVSPVPGSGNGILAQEPDLIDKLKKQSGEESASKTAPVSSTATAIRVGEDLAIESSDDTRLPDHEFEFGDDLVSAPRPVSKKKRDTEEEKQAGISADTAEAGSDASKVEAPRRFAVSFAGESLDEPVLIPLLESAVASLEATTVVVLSRIAESSRYRISAIVSRNELARAGGQFTVDSTYMPRRRKKNEVVHLLQNTTLDNAHSRYYEGEVVVAHQAIIPIAATTGEYLLVADFPDSVSETERIDPLMVGYSSALRAVLSSSTIFSNAALAKTSVVVSRALSRSRAEKTPLAMALVCMKDGERFLASERDIVLKSERELEEILQDITDEGKIEKLADLTFGVFLSEEVNRVEQWALKLQDVVDERASSPDVTASIVGSVTVGVAMLSDRHKSADDLREDALAALEESFQSGACTILE